MKIEIYQKDAVTPELVRLELHQEPAGVSLDCVNKDGTTIREGHLLRVNDDGTIILWGSVNPKLGFQRDSAGRVVVRSC